MRNLFFILFSKTFLCFMAIAAFLSAIVFLCILVPSALPLTLALSGAFLLQAVAAYALFQTDLSAQGKVSWLVFMLCLPVIGPVFCSLCITSMPRPKMGQCQKATYRRVEYFDEGKVWTDALFFHMRRATESVYLDFFIIAKGQTFERLLSTVKELKKRNVDVRILADGMGSAFRLTSRQVRQLKKCGAKIVIFRPPHPIGAIKMNYRDHRKLAVIDGNLLFTGGINLADEYSNLTAPYGYWKDSGILVVGEVARIAREQFLDRWNVLSSPKRRNLANVSATKYANVLQADPATASQTDHTTEPVIHPVTAPDTKPAAASQTDPATEPVIHPATAPVNPSTERQCLIYCDHPPVSCGMGEALIVHAIEEAKETISIFTPYFCPTERAMAALTFAALRGVKITIILPHIPDKYSALVLSRAFAHKLTSYGVGVYELTAGFMHAKNILIDDTLFLGSYNFDCRSFHANQECGLCFFGGNAVRQAREDFANTLPLCLPLAPHPSFRDKLLYTLLAPFAPLL